jgi:hypothetical protein
LCGFQLTVCSIGGFSQLARGKSSPADDALEKFCLSAQKNAIIIIDVDRCKHVDQQVAVASGWFSEPAIDGGSHFFLNPDLPPQSGFRHPGK